MGPFQIFQKINDNTYRLHLPSHLKTSDVFNVKHLVRYISDIDPNLRTSSFGPREDDVGVVLSPLAPI